MSPSMRLMRYLCEQYVVEPLQSFCPSSNVAVLGDLSSLFVGFVKTLPWAQFAVAQCAAVALPSVGMCEIV